MRLRDETDELQSAIEQHEQRGDFKSVAAYQQKLNKTQQLLLEKNKLRLNARLSSQLHCVIIFICLFNECVFLFDFIVSILCFIVFIVH